MVNKLGKAVLFYVQQDISGHRRPFALAVSLPEDVSGIGLASMADISHICNSATCDFYFGWESNSFNPILTCAFSSHAGRSWICCTHTLRHWLDNILLTPRTPATLNTLHRLIEAVRVVMQQPLTRLVPTGIHGEKRKNYMILRPDRIYDLAQRQSLPDSLTQFEQWQGVQVYSLGHPVVHCSVRWCTYNVILHELAHFLREHLRNLIGIHHVQCALAGPNMRQKNPSFCSKLTVWHLGQQNSLSFWMLRFTLKHFLQVSSEHLRLPEGFIE